MSKAKSLVDKIEELTLNNWDRYNRGKFVAIVPKSMQQELGEYFGMTINKGPKYSIDPETGRVTKEEPALEPVGGLQIATYHGSFCDVAIEYFDDTGEVENDTEETRRVVEVDAQGAADA